MALQPQTEQAGTPLHATWWQVLKPRLTLLPNGQPGYDIIATCETLPEATQVAATHRGALVVVNVVVFINNAPVQPLAAKPQ